jgi:hypothetical protein
MRRGRCAEPLGRGRRLRHGRRVRAHGWRLHDHGRRVRAHGRRLHAHRRRLHHHGWRLRAHGRRLHARGCRLVGRRQGHARQDPPAHLERRLHEVVDDVRLDDHGPGYRRDGLDRERFGAERYDDFARRGRHGAF